VVSGVSRSLDTYGRAIVGDAALCCYRWDRMAL